MLEVLRGDEEGVVATEGVEVELYRVVGGGDGGV